MDLHSLGERIFTAILSSVATVGLMQAWNWYRLWWQYAKLKGTYVVYSTRGEPVPGEKVTLEYVGSRSLKTTSATGGVENWNGLITMSEDLPGFGSGVFQYSAVFGCGMHQIQVNATDGSIYVQGVNTVGGDSSYPFSYVLRRANQATSD